MNIFQIGVCQSNDDVHAYIRDNKINPDLLVLVEPMSIHNEEIWEVYKTLDCIDLDNVKLENLAITTQSTGDISFYYHPNDSGNPSTPPSFEVSSVDPMHLVKHGYRHDELIELKVPTLTMDKLFDKYNVTDIDLLAIDTEGLDDTILKSIDHSRFNIKKIIFENLHIKDQNIYSFLESCGYTIVDKNYGSAHDVGFNVLVEKNDYR